MTIICHFNISSLSHNFIPSYIFWNNSTPYTERHIFEIEQNKGHFTKESHLPSKHAISESVYAETMQSLTPNST